MPQDKPVVLSSDVLALTIASIAHFVMESADVTVMTNDGEIQSGRSFDVFDRDAMDSAVAFLDPRTRSEIVSCVQFAVPALLQYALAAARYKEPPSLN